MIEIKLPNGKWLYDPIAILGEPGGFGTVYLGSGESYEEVAIKKLRFDVNDLAHRELRIADEFSGRSFKYVIPIFDAGQDVESDAYFVVMARAEKSLEDEVNNLGNFTVSNTVEVFSNIVDGLLEVQDIVHRDLKPGNVLYHEESWKLADFGIARFVESATSAHTLKGCLSPYYAAPEQWRGERATNATDVYALGCIGYTLLTGEPPFKGTTDELQNCHLNINPKPIASINPRLRSLLAGMLRKDPETRPGLQRIKIVLNELTVTKGVEEGGPGAKLIADADAIQSERIAEAEAVQRKRESEQNRRLRISEAAFQNLREIVEDLVSKITKTALQAQKLFSGSNLHGVRLGSGILEVEFFTKGTILSDNLFGESGWDVFAGAAVIVKQESTPQYEWSASLWFTDLGLKQGYRWYEVPYMKIFDDKPLYEPFALDNVRDADLAASKTMHTFQLAAKPRPIDDEDKQDFFERWMTLLAKASKGELSYPSRLPLD